MDGAYAARTATKMYRTTPLRGSGNTRRTSTMGARRRLPTWPATTIACSVSSYDPQKRDLVEYLKTL